LPLSERENYLRNARFAGPEWIPTTVVISEASWNQLREEAEEVVLRHPTIFPGYQRGQRKFANLRQERKAGTRTMDCWGCVWHAEIDGLTGIVEGHPLEDWNKLSSYQAPDPMEKWEFGAAQWDQAEQQVRAAKQQGRLASGSTAHGFLFMRLYYLRKFENLMLDFATEPPQLQQLIEIVNQYNLRYVQKWLSLGIDLLNFGDDLGTQTASIISAQTFSKWITPAYRRAMQPCKEAGVLVALHSDGHIMELMDEFVKAGVDIINPQDLCNGIDNLAREVKGRMCIRLDIDRQFIIPYGTRRDIHDLIEEETRKLGSPAGGLEFIAGIYPPTPAENIDALCCALEKFRTYWWD